MERLAVFKEYLPRLTDSSSAVQNKNRQPNFHGKFGWRAVPRRKLRQRLGDFYVPPSDTELRLATIRRQKTKHRVMRKKRHDRMRVCARRATAGDGEGSTGGLAGVDEGSRYAAAFEGLRVEPADGAAAALLSTQQTGSWRIEQPPLLVSRGSQESGGLEFNEKRKLKKLREKDAENLTSVASTSGHEESIGERTMLISCVTTGNKTGPTHPLAPPPPAGSRDESPLAYAGDVTSATIADDDDAEADAAGRDAAEKIDEAAAAVEDSEEAAQGEEDPTHDATRLREEAAEASSNLKKKLKARSALPTRSPPPTRHFLHAACRLFRFVSPSSSQLKVPDTLALQIADFALRHTSAVSVAAIQGGRKAVRMEGTGSAQWFVI
jgi:hypothetical protein